MRFCIESLMKLEQVEDSDRVQFRNIEDDDMDEEDHEALCNLFTTVSQWLQISFEQKLNTFMNNVLNRAFFSVDRESNRQPQGPGFHESILR